MSRRVQRTIARTFLSFPFLSVTAVSLSISALEHYWDGISPAAKFIRAAVPPRNENPRCLVFLARFFVAVQFRPNKIGTHAEIEISSRIAVYVDNYI